MLGGETTGFDGDSLEMINTYWHTDEICLRYADLFAPTGVADGAEETSLASAYVTRYTKPYCWWPLAAGRWPLAAGCCSGACVFTPAVWCSARSGAARFFETLPAVWPERACVPCVEGPRLSFRLGFFAAATRFVELDVGASR